MTSLHPAKLLFLFTPGMSVERWSDRGYLVRELKIYSRISEHIDELWWYSYGPNDDQYRSLLNKHNISLFSPDRNGRKYLEEKGTEYYNTYALKEYRSFFEQFDILKTNQFSSAYFGRAVKSVSNAKLVIRQGRYYPLAFKLLRKKPWVGLKKHWDEPNVYQSADSIFVPLTPAKEKIVERTPDLASKIHVIPNAIDTDLFTPSEIQNEGRKLLFIGRLVIQKNILELLKAIRTLDCSLTVIGRGRFRNTVQNYEDGATEIDITLESERPYEELTKVYNNHDALVLPSLYEGCPKVLLEAMACGKVVIGTDVWGIRNIIEDGSNGILSKGVLGGISRFSIREVIEKFLDNRFGNKKLCQAARKTVEERFSLSNLLKKELEIYDKLLSD